MSQHIQHHQPQYVHYNPPSASAGPAPPHHSGYIQNVPMMQSAQGAMPQGVQQPPIHIMHYQQPTMVHQGMPQQPLVQQTHAQAQQLQQQQQQMGQPSQGANGATASGSTTGSASTGPVVATGDWTKDLVQLAKQAELKKHALTLQLHTAHILSAHATLEAKSRAIQDVKEQKNKLDSERARLLKCLQEINADRDKADLAEGTMLRECEDLRTKITQLSEGEYAIAKADVDRLRADLGQPPLPSLQQTLEERTAQFLTERRLNGNEPDYSGSSTPGPSSSKRTLDGATPDGAVVKRPRGRPKGSKNKKHVST